MTPPLHTHTTQVREGRDEGWFRVGREEGDLRALKETVGKKTKRNLERAC